MVITALVFSTIFTPSVYLTFDGSYPGLIWYLTVFSFNAVVGVIWLIVCMSQWLAGEDINSRVLMSSLVGIVFIAIGIRCLNSNMFVSMMTQALHNRVLRKVLKLHNRPEHLKRLKRRRRR